MTSQILNSIVTIGTVLSALGVLAKLLQKMHEFLTMQEGIVKDMQRVKQEQRLVYNGLVACLDGLEQLGCNHTVPHARDELEKWLNEQAHD